MLSGRLGLETARIPHEDRHGLLWLSRGNLYVEDGTLRFAAAEGPDFKMGEYAIPFQAVSFIMLGPGTTISHDALRIMARHGTGMAAIGEDGVRFYTAPPVGADSSARARRQVRAWGEETERIRLVRRMYAWRLREILPATDINALRGIEGARMKEVYALTATKYGIQWKGRRYDRANPDAADPPNQAINHAATAVEAAASIAVAATSTIPQLGFIHEDSANAFSLDIADLFRDEVTIPVAFQAVKLAEKSSEISLERHVRKLAGQTFRRSGVIPKMIDRIKELFDGDDGRSDA